MYIVYFFILASCPSDCSGHGICSTLADFSFFRGPDYDNSVVQAGDGLGTEYSHWDSGTQICQCDSGYFGPDCSLSKL